MLRTGNKRGSYLGKGVEEISVGGEKRALK
jgi:hypothetical protein